MKKIKIGKILKPQGLKGQVKLKPYGTDLTFFDEGNTLLLENDEKIDIATTSIRSGGVYLTFENLNVIEDIEFLKSQEVYILEEQLKNLDEGEFFVKDLLNAQVLNQAGELIGVIKEIDSFGTADVYTIKHKGNEVLFAFVDGLFESVDIENHKIVVNDKLFEEVMV